MKEDSGRHTKAIVVKNRLEQLIDIGIALSAERNIDLLLDKILKETRRFTSADSGTLYVREGDFLRFAVTQNDTLARRARDKRNDDPYLDRLLPISHKSVAGYVAETGETLNIADVYEVSGKPYTIDKSFDEENDYRTKSMMVVPMKDRVGNVIGVLQLINSTGDGGDVVPFAEKLEHLVESLASQAAVAMLNARLTKDLKKSHLETIFRLAVAAEYKDQDTAAHIKRISGYSAVLARRLGLDEREVETITYASPMHDVGKIGVPDAILMKPGKLTDEERSIMQRHAAIGAKILENPDCEITKASYEIALSHHEKWDGTGYPRGLAGEEIPLFGRIVGIIDVFDALASERCYKPPYDMTKVIGIIKEERGKHFDPACVDAFFDCLDEIVIIFQSHTDQ